MHIELTQPQHELVVSILLSRLDDLRQEIRHSSVSKFTDKLKEREKLLKSVIHNLQLADTHH